MTPAHSAGTAVFSSLRQLATMASRSTVSTPVASASAAAWLASGDSTPPASDFGSDATFMPQFYALHPRGSTALRNEYRWHSVFERSMPSDLIRGWGRFA